MQAVKIVTYNGNNICFCTKYPLEKIYEFVDKNFNFSVDNIIKELDLQRPIYYDLASYGHFGRKEYPWEKTKEFKI